MFSQLSLITASTCYDFLSGPLSLHYRQPCTVHSHTHILTHTYLHTALVVVSISAVGASQWVGEGACEIA